MPPAMLANVSLVKVSRHVERADIGGEKAACYDSENYAADRGYL